MKPASCFPSVRINGPPISSTGGAGFVLQAAFPRFLGAGTDHLKDTYLRQQSALIPVHSNQKEPAHLLND